MKKVLSMILALMMILSMIPMTALAAGTGTADDPIVLDTNGNYTAEIAEYELYYQYVVTKTGTISVSFEDENQEGTAIEVICGDADIYLPGEDENGDIVRSADIEVAAGDVVDIVAFTEAEDGIANVVFYFQFTEPEGTESNPIKIISSEPATITVPANETVYYCNTGNVNGMIFTLTGGLKKRSVGVGHNGKTYYSNEDGVVTFTCSQADPSLPGVYAVTNRENQDGVYVVTFNAVEGSMDNKAALKMGENTATVKAGSLGYFYTWTAEKAGTLSISMTGENWLYVLSNITASKYGETQYSDSDPVVNPGTITVAAGDVVEVQVNTYNPDDIYNAPAGDITFTVDFVEDPNGGEGDEGGEDIGDITGTTVEVTADAPAVVQYTPEADGTLSILIAGDPGFKIEVYGPDGETVGLPENGNKAQTVTYTLSAGVTYDIIMHAYNTTTWSEVDGTVTYNLSFVAGEGSEDTSTTVEVTADAPAVVEYTPETNGTLSVLISGNPGFKLNVYDSNGDTIGLPKSASKEQTVTYELSAGVTYTITMHAYSTSAWGSVDGTVTYSLSFASSEGGGETTKAEYEVSDTALVLGNNSLTLLDTAVTTIFVFQPAETGIYTFTGPEGAILGYWGAGSWFLADPGSTSNVCQWTCTGVGQDAYIGISGVDGTFNVTVAKIGEYVEGYEKLVYENQHKDSAKPYVDCLKVIESVAVGGTKMAVLSEDGYYHLNSADGAILLLDINDEELPIGTAYANGGFSGAEYDENGKLIKAISYYKALGEYIIKTSTVVNGETKNTYYNYVPLNQDLITIIQEVGKNPSNNWFSTTGAAMTDAEDAWLFMCVTAELEHTIVNGECTVCGATGEEENACQHEYTYACDKLCAKCGELTNPEATHNVIHVAAADATCGENGNIEYWYCDICGAAWADEAQTMITNLRSVITPATGEHNYVQDGDCTATCKEDGEVMYFCDVCGDDKTETVTAYHNGNLEYHAAKDAIDCANPGNIEHYSCPSCGQYFSDAMAENMINPDIIEVTADCVRPEDAPDCATVTCETCGNDIYGYGEHDVLACQGGTCSKCNAEIEGYGCANYDTPACEDGVCYYCGGFVAGFGHENGAWAACCEGECSYGCGLIFPATEDHLDADADDYCDKCWNHLNHDVDPCYGGECSICWTYIEGKHNVIHVEAKAPTCTAMGNIEYWYCDVCGAAWLDEACTLNTNQKAVVLPMADHEYFYACDLVCMNCYELTNPEAAHAIKHVAAVEATCQAPGNIEYYTCEYCNGCWDNENAAGMPLNAMMVKTFKDHEYDNACDVDCNECGETREVTHNVIHVEAKAATCTETGNIEYWYCDVCGAAWLDEACTLNTNLQAVKLGATCATNAVHNEGVAAGCHYTGRTENWYCANCDVYYLDADCTIVTNYKSLTIPTLGGEVVHVEAKEATDCQTMGNIEYWYCETCEQVWQDETLTQLTNFMNVKTGYGEHAYFYPCDAHCMVCGELTNENAAHTIHHVEAKAATYEADGNVEYWYCEHCGSVWTDEALTQVSNRMNVIIPKLTVTVVATINGVEYKTLTEALAAAKSGQTVEVVADTEESYLIITPGVTLDLNACTVKADYVIGLNGSNLVANNYSAKNAYAKLIVAKNSLALTSEDSTNRLPVWVNDHYVFMTSYTNETVSFSAEDGMVEVEFAPDFSSAAVALFKANGVSAHGISIIVRVNYAEEQPNGLIPITKDYFYTDDLVQSVLGANKLKATMSGCDELINLSFAVVIVSNTGAEHVAGTYTYEAN